MSIQKYEIQNIIREQDSKCMSEKMILIRSDMQWLGE